MQFASYLEKKMQNVPKRLVFVIGGPYGFSEVVYKTASEKVSLSKMTFSHQMIRLIFIEQLYRAMTILNHVRGSNRFRSSCRLQVSFRRMSDH